MYQRERHQDRQQYGEDERIELRDGVMIGWSDAIRVIGMG
jgi:hypothetical protein